MGDRAIKRGLSRFEDQDRRRIESAAVKIAADHDLRFLVWTLHEAAGMARDPFTGNALTTAHNAGKMSIIADLVNLINQTEPQFYGRLLQEMNSEQRTRRDYLAERADSGRADDDYD
jgi:hypothetical protein